MDDWRGDNPFYLIIHHQQPSDGVWVNTVIDLDEQGWTATNASLMRLPGAWFLVEKDTRNMTLAIPVNEGDQPYYVARHHGMGRKEDFAQVEVIAFGIGKKRPDGFVERLWHIREAKMTTTGDDIEYIVRPILQAKFELLSQLKEAITLNEKPTE